MEDCSPSPIIYHHGQLFAELGQEPRLNATLFLRKIGDLVPTTDAIPDPIHSRPSGVLTHVAMARLI
jgi:hypothetical protein